MATEYNAVGWFEIPVTDMQRAKTFYEQVLGLTLELHDVGPLSMAWFPMYPQAKGAAGSLVKHEAYIPSHQGILVYFSVTDIDAVLKRVAQSGGKILSPRKPIGDYGFVGHFQDTEGNRMAVHSLK